jgi:hypothetical protein
MPEAIRAEVRIATWEGVDGMGAQYVSPWPGAAS